MDTKSKNIGSTETGNSYLQLFFSCQKKFDWRYVYRGGLVPKEESPALLIGRAVHEALRVWHTYQDFDLAIKALEEVIPLTHSHYGVALATFSGYTLAYPKDKELNFIVQEFETSINVGGFTYTMRIDGIARYLNEFYVVEHKTCSQALPTYFKQFENDRQITGYLLGVQKEIPHMIVGGIIVNALKKPKKLKTGYSQPEYERAILLRTEYQIDWWKQDTIKTFEEIEQCKATGGWTHNTKECYAFNSPCPYLSLCKYGPMPALMGEYTIGEEVEKDDSQDSTTEPSTKG